MEAEAKKIEPMMVKKPLTREQRRAMDRLNKEVGDIIARLVNQWYEFFLDNDPDSEEVKTKQKEVSAKWRMYCKRKHLKAEAFTIVDKSITQLMEEYHEYQKARAEQ